MAVDTFHPVGWDLLSELPPEVVLKITTFLKVQDVLKCLSVCKQWFKVLSLGEMTPFWRRACLHAGLPDYYIKQRMTYCIFPSELFHEIRLHKETVASLHPEISSLSGIHPLESTMKCEYAGNGFFVKTVDYTSLAYEETVIGRLCPDKKSITKLDSFIGKSGQVIWARCFAGNVLYETNGSNWYRYHIKTRQFFELSSGRLQRGVWSTIGHCRHCLILVLAGTENTMHGYSWLFHFFVYNNGRDQNPVEQKCKLPIPPGITQFIPRPVKAHLLQENGSCSSHRLIIQGGTGACVFRVTHDDEGIKISPKPIGTLNPFYDTEAAVMVVNTTSVMTLSHDEQVIGILTNVVYPFTSGLCLHIFETDTYKRVLSVKVDWKDGFNDAEVLALSRFYTVLGVGHSKGIVKIVDSHTGRVLLSRAGLSRGLPPVVPMMRLLSVHFQGTYGDECLVDIRQRFFSLMVLFRKGVGNIEAVCFAPFQSIEYDQYIVELEQESEDDRTD